MVDFGELVVQGIDLPNDSLGSANGSRCYAPSAARSGHHVGDLLRSGARQCAGLLKSEPTEQFLDRFGSAGSPSHNGERPGVDHDFIGSIATPRKRRRRRSPRSDRAISKRSEYASECRTDGSQISANGGSK